MHPRTLISPPFVLRFCRPRLCQISVKNCFIRGSVVRYVQLPAAGVDVEILHDATRREARGS